MAELIYTAILSLDGYIEDPSGNFDFYEPEEEFHTFINDLERGAGIHLYGRRLYETMAVWETDPSLAAAAPYTRDYAQIWQAAEKIVYSRTLPAVWTTRTHLERAFDAPAVRELKASAARDIAIGGANLAAQAFRAGLVDRCRLFVVPVILGGGKRGLPADVRLALELEEQRRFGSGLVYLGYRVRDSSS